MSRRLVIEADGGSRGNPGPAAYGTVVRDADTGEVLVERAEAIGRASNNVAEYRGLLAGLEEVQRIDPDADLEVRMDSKLVVEQMAGRWKIKHPDMRELALAAQRLRNPATVRWTWVPRAQNGHADRLLNEVLDGGSVAVQPAPPRPMMRPPSLGEPTTLFVVRHGETPLTEGRRFSGRGGLDPGLTDAGREQASHAAAVLEARLAGTSLAAILVSPLLRSRETAGVIAERLRVPVEVEDDFAEMAFGEWDGLSFAEARALDPAHFDAWLLDPELSPPGGESLAALRDRVREAQARTLARFPGERVLVVAHAMPVKVLVADALSAPLESAHRVEVAPASVAEISYWSDGRPMIRALGLR